MSCLWLSQTTRNYCFPPQAMQSSKFSIPQGLSNSRSGTRLVYMSCMSSTRHLISVMSLPWSTAKPSKQSTSVLKTLQFKFDLRLLCLLSGTTCTRCLNDLESLPPRSQDDDTTSFSTHNDVKTLRTKVMPMMIVP